MLNWLKKVGHAVYALLGAALSLVGGCALCFPPFWGDYYEPPYSDQCLWCNHQLATSPDGRVYCAKWPPKDIKIASVSPRTKLLRRTAGALCAAAGLACAGWMAVDGWLKFRGRPSRFQSRLSRWMLRLTAPPASLLLYAASIWLYAVYGFVPR